MSNLIVNVEHPPKLLPLGFENENNEGYLTGADLLQRGDVIRTRAPARQGGGGHNVIWI